MDKVCKTCGGFDICIMGHAGRTADCPEWRPKWIPVSEELPDEGQAVLCLRRNGSYWVAQWTYIDWEWYDENEWHVEKEVTHWMPLPEPPKEVIDIEQIEVE